LFEMFSSAGVCLGGDDLYHGIACDGDDGDADFDYVRVQELQSQPLSARSTGKCTAGINDGHG